MSPFDFTDKVAIVTGAGRGIGRAYAESLASAGASVVVADIDESSAMEVAGSIEKAGGRAVGIKVDVAEENSTDNMAACAVENFGGIDYLVNNGRCSGGSNSTCVDGGLGLPATVHGGQPDRGPCLHASVLPADRRAREERS